MICPACRKPTIVVEHENIELDYCTSCSGVWFDTGELELLLESMQLEKSSLSLENILALPETMSTEKKRRCPICRQKMRKATIGKEPEVLIDVCSQGEGLWFDGGEINQIISQCVGKSCAETDSQSRVLSFLRDTFKFGSQPES